jgi:hypothetical protein
MKRRDGKLARAALATGGGARRDFIVAFAVAVCRIGALTHI